MNTETYKKVSRDEKQWDFIISSKDSFFALNLKEIIGYFDLIYMFVHRDFVTQFKQTILGPLWFILQPLLTTLVFTVIFGNIAQLSTDGLPQVLFYLSGTVIWSYVSMTMVAISDTNITNKQLFNKVYFPRLVVPIALSISNFLKLLLQLTIYAIFCSYYFYSGADISVQSEILLFPLLMIIMVFISMGLGLIFAAITAKYRDLRMLLQFLIQLVMYATPVIYPVSMIPEKWVWLMWLNPMSSIIESFRFFTLGTGAFDLAHLGYSLTISLILLYIGLLMFNQRQRRVADII